MQTWQQLDHAEIDEFRAHAYASLNHRLKHLDSSEVTADHMGDPRDLEQFQEHVDEQAMSVLAARDLADELCILALYRKVETKMIELVAKTSPSIPLKTLLYYDQFRKALPFPIETVDGYVAFIELRLLNKSIKRGGIVSVKLASTFPHSWIHGSQLVGLGTHYERLLPAVKRYVADLGQKLRRESAFHAMRRTMFPLPAQSR